MIFLLFYNANIRHFRYIISGTCTGRSTDTRPCNTHACDPCSDIKPHCTNDSYFTTRRHLKNLRNKCCHKRYTLEYTGDSTAHSECTTRIDDKTHINHEVDGRCEKEKFPGLSQIGFLENYGPQPQPVLEYAAEYLDSHPYITEEQLEEVVKHHFPAKRSINVGTLFGK